MYLNIFILFKLEGTPLSLLEMTDAFVNIEQHVQAIHEHL